MTITINIDTFNLRTYFLDNDDCHSFYPTIKIYQPADSSQIPSCTSQLEPLRCIASPRSVGPRATMIRREIEVDMNPDQGSVAAQRRFRTATERIVATAVNHYGV